MKMDSTCLRKKRHETFERHYMDEWNARALVIRWSFRWRWASFDASVPNKGAKWIWSSHESLEWWIERTFESIDASDIRMSSHLWEHCVKHSNVLTVMGMVLQLLSCINSSRVKHGTQFWRHGSEAFSKQWDACSDDNESYFDKEGTLKAWFEALSKQRGVRTYDEGS